MDLYDDGFGGKRRAPRIGFELMVRCSHRSNRSTVLLKDMTRYGARIEGIAKLRLGEVVTLMLPGVAARMAFVMWTQGSSAGLEFGDPIEQGAFDAIIRDFAIGQVPPPPGEPSPFSVAA